MAQVSIQWPSGDGEMVGRIRSFDWASTPLGPIADWPQSLKTIVDLMLSSRSMMSLVWGPEAVHLYNDSFTELLREHHILALGRSAFETFARSRDVFEADVAAGMAGRSARLLAQRYPVLRRGRLEDAWFDVDYAPIRDEAGAVAGVLWILKETTAQQRAEQALRANEERHRLLIASWAQAEWETDADGVVAADSPSWRAYTGQTLEEWLGHGWLDAIHPEDRAYAERQWREAMAAHAVVDAEFRLRSPDGGWRWTNVRAAPMLNAQGVIEKWVGVNVDIDARKRSEVELRESEARFAHFAASSSDALWIRDATTLAVEYTSPAIQTIYGISPDGILGDMQRWAELIVPEDRDTAIAHIEQAQAGASVTHEFRIQRPLDGQERWICNTDFPLRDQHGRVQRIGGIAQDITETKRAARRLEVLINELQHRARNLLGVVSAMASRTLVQGAPIAPFAERLQALSRAQGLLSQGGSDTVEVGTLVRAELAAYADWASNRVTISGPEVHLTARQVQNFALALHELTTNAVKYGALKSQTGQLAVTWTVLHDRRERRRLAVTWVESGVAVEPERITRRGYGTELIQEALAYALEADVAYALERTGVRCRIEMPIP